MGREFLADLHDLLIQRMRRAAVNLHDDGLILNIADDHADALFPVAPDFNYSFTHFIPHWTFAARAVCSV